MTITPCEVFAPSRKKQCRLPAGWVVNADSLIPDLFIAHLGESQTLPSGGGGPHLMMTADQECHLSSFINIFNLNFQNLLRRMRQ